MLAAVPGGLGTDSNFYSVQDEQFVGLDHGLSERQYLGDAIVTSKRGVANILGKRPNNPEAL
jgi:hypothetical protein